MKNRRYQAFVSSTYTDLIEERKEVTQAILENNCFPAGMELFPAANQSQWEFIKKVIKESDFYIVIIAGRYGSIGEDEEGKKVSYTEMEYDYACKIKKPIIVLLHKNIENLPKSKCETTSSKNTKLMKFIEKVQKGRLIKYWTTPGELHAATGLSIKNLIEDSGNGMIGWIHADEIVKYEKLLTSRKTKKSIKEELKLKLEEAYKKTCDIRGDYIDEAKGIKKAIQDLRNQIKSLYFFSERYSKTEPLWFKRVTEIYKMLESRIVCYVNATEAEKSMEDYHLRNEMDAFVKMLLEAIAYINNEKSSAKDIIISQLNEENRNFKESIKNQRKGLDSLEERIKLLKDEKADLRKIILQLYRDYPKKDSIDINYIKQLEKEDEEYDEWMMMYANALQSAH